MRKMMWLAAVALVATPAFAGENWPQFRGPTCDGQTDATGLALEWSETRNVTWKTAIHDRGWSSPVISSDQIWMTTATREGKELFVVCVDRLTGRIVHDVKIFRVRAPEKINSLNSYASPTAAVEAGRVYVHFGTYGTACLDTATGKTIWARRDLHCDHAMGPGSSVVLHGKLLILTYDGMDVQYVIALDKTTGKTVWKTSRSTDFGTIDGDLRKAYSTPSILNVAGRQELVTCGAGAAIAYEPDTGKELWKCRYKGGYSNVSRPMLAAGLVLVNSGFNKARLIAVRPGGRGDVTDTHVAWRYTRYVPIKPSLAVVNGLILMTADSSVLTCLDAKTGRMLWSERIGGKFSASPLIAGNRVYFFDDRGTTTVVEAARKYRKLAVNKLDAGCMASPAVAGKAIFLRTKTHLYRIEKK